MTAYLRVRDTTLACPVRAVTNGKHTTFHVELPSILPDTEEVYLELNPAELRGHADLCDIKARDLTPSVIDRLRGELSNVLQEVKWSYYQSMCRFAWQMNWDKNREALPPPMDTLSEEQLRHLITLIRTNVVGYRR